MISCIREQWYYWMSHFCQVEPSCETWSLQVGACIQIGVLLKMGCDAGVHSYSQRHVGSVPEITSGTRLWCFGFTRCILVLRTELVPMLDWYTGLHLLHEQKVLTFIINIRNKVNSYAAYTGKVFGGGGQGRERLQKILTDSDSSHCSQIYPTGLAHILWICIFLDIRE